MSVFRRLACGIGLVLMCVSGVAAQQPDAGLSFSFKQFDFRRLNMGMPKLVYASGEINARDLARLTAFNAQNAVGCGAVLVLDSPGGNVFEAMAVARYIRLVGMDTCRLLCASS